MLVFIGVAYYGDRLVPACVRCQVNSLPFIALVSVKETASTVLVFPLVLPQANMLPLISMVALASDSPA